VEEEAIRVDVKIHGLVIIVQHRFVGSHEPPPRDDEIGSLRSHRAGRLDAPGNVVLVYPIVRIEQADAAIPLGRGEKQADAAGGIAAVAVLLVENDVPRLPAVDPFLRKAVGDKNVICLDELFRHTIDASL